MGSHRGGSTTTHSLISILGIKLQTIDSTIRSILINHSVSYVCVYHYVWVLIFQPCAQIRGISNVRLLSWVSQYKYLDVMKKITNYEQLTQTFAPYEEISVPYIQIFYSLCLFTHAESMISMCVILDGWQSGWPPQHTCFKVRSSLFQL